MLEHVITRRRFDGDLPARELSQPVAHVHRVGVDRLGREVPLRTKEGDEGIEQRVAHEVILQHSRQSPNNLP